MRGTHESTHELDTHMVEDTHELDTHASGATSRRGPDHDLADHGLDTHMGEGAQPRRLPLSISDNLSRG